MLTSLIYVSLIGRALHKQFNTTIPSSTKIGDDPRFSTSTSEKLPPWQIMFQMYYIVLRHPVKAQAEKVSSCEEKNLS